MLITKFKHIRIMNAQQLYEYLSDYKTIYGVNLEKVQLVFGHSEESIKIGKFEISNNEQEMKFSETVYKAVIAPPKPVLHLKREDFLEWYFDQTDDYVNVAVMVLGEMKANGKSELRVQDLLDDQETLQTDLFEERHLYKDEDMLQLANFDVRLIE